MQLNSSKKKFAFVRSQLIWSLLLMVCVSCKDFVEIDVPETDIFAEVVFQSDETATAAVLHLYTDMNTASSFSGGGTSSLSSLQGLSSDELTLVVQDQERESFYLNNVLPNSAEISNIWTTCYNIIYAANAIIEGLTSSSQISSEIRTQLEGEAKFIRAFCHFYLLNLFGDIPYISTTDYRVNSVVSRTTLPEVYQLIIEDLIEAKNLLTDEYPSEGRVRPNKGTATALLARVYLYNEDWTNAEIQATEVINNTSLYSLSDLNQVFLIDSDEAIWRLFPEENANNGYDGETFIVVDAPNFVVLREEFINAFEDGDARLTNWVGSITTESGTYIFPFKYKSQMNDPTSEYSMVLRLAEQYLIRAEARTQQNRLAEAISDLDMIRQRAELSLINDINPSIGQSDLLSAITQERRVELFTEWGHRWFDLKRIGSANVVLGAIKIGWEQTDVLLPLPENELELNQNLTQNPGY